MDMKLVKEYSEIFRIPEPVGEPLIFLIRGFERAQKEILEDMVSGVVATTVKSYDELKQFVEQPGDYGGFNTMEIQREGMILFPPFETGRIIFMGDLVHYGNALTIVRAWIGRWLSTEPGKALDLTARCAKGEGAQVSPLGANPLPKGAINEG